MRETWRSSVSAQVLGVVTVPRALPRFVRLPAQEGHSDYLLLQDLIAQHLGGMYRGYEVLAHASFRVTRNSNLYFEEEEARSLLEVIRVELHNRRKGDAVRLEIETEAAPEIVERLRVNFELEEDQVFRSDGPVNLSRLMFFYSDVQRPDLKFQSFTPRPLVLSRKSAGIFDELRHRDILLHHPYDSYDPVVEFVQQGAQDPAVVTMKQTLYRTSHDSPMFQALIEAAATKEATLVVELMARFDEASKTSAGRAAWKMRGVQVSSWRGGAEDALQAGHAGASRRRRADAALLPPGNGQLQSRDGAILYRPEPADFRPADYRAGAYGVQLPDRARGD